MHEAFRAALPKAMYWLGTGCLIHGTLASLWPAAIRQQLEVTAETTLTDAVFAASVRFAHKRYLAGQAVLATTIAEKSWVGRNVPYRVDAADLTPMLLRILRASPGPVIDTQSILTVNLGLKRWLPETRRRSAKQTWSYSKCG